MHFRFTEKKVKKIMHLHGAVKAIIQIEYWTPFCMQHFFT